MTQTQFEKLLHKTYYKTIKQKENLENKVKALGEEEVNLLKDYVNKQFSDQAEEVKVTLLEKYIMDDKARTVALNHRNKILNTAIPGISQINPASYAVNYEDVLKAREAANKNPSNRRLQEKYINLTAAYSNQNKAQ